MDHTDSLDVLEIELDKLRHIQFPVPAQIELEDKLGLSMMELAAKLAAHSPKTIRQTLYIGLKHADPKLGPFSTMDPLLEKARLRKIEITEGGVTKTRHVTNGYIAGRLLDALRAAGAYGEPEEEATSGPAADPTPGRSGTS